MPEDLTILLILKDRTPFTWRWLHHANTIKLPYKVIIADGGEDFSLENKLADKKQFPNVNYDYIRYPHDKDIATYFLKLANSSKLIKTSFVLLASNHDFYFIDSIKESLEFLKSHPDFASVRGEIYDISIQDKKIKDFHKTYFNPANTANTGLERLEAYSKKPGSLWHDINRTINIQKAFTHFHESGINDIVLAEYLLNAIIVLSGKTHRTDKLHMLHQEPVDGLGLTLSKRDPIEWMASENWSEYFLGIINIISNELATRDDIAKNVSYNKSLQIFLAYFLGKNMISDHSIRKSDHSQSFIIRRSRFINKNNVFNKIGKKIYLFAKNHKQNSLNKNIVQTSPYGRELRQIEDFLRS